MPQINKNKEREENKKFSKTFEKNISVVAMIKIWILKNLMFSIFRELVNDFWMFLRFFSIIDVKEVLLEEN